MGEQGSLSRGLSEMETRELRPEGEQRTAYKDLRGKAFQAGETHAKALGWESA